MDVFRHTCRHYDPSLTYPNNHYGYGEIDVYRGLLYLLSVEGIEGVSTTHTKARVSYSGGRLTVSLTHPATRATTVTVYALSGSSVFTATLPAGQATFTQPLPHLPHGIYVVQLNSPGGDSGSTLISL